MRTLLILGIMVIWALMRCSDLVPTAGGSTTSDNAKVMATVYNTKGSPAAGAVVRLRRSDYVSQSAGLAKQAVSTADTLTDAQGRFEFKGIDSGAYRIEVADPSTGSGLGGAVLFDCSIHGHDSINLGPDTLRPYAAISGTIDSLQGPAYVQVYGLERIVRVDSSGRFTITDLPQGALDLRIAKTGDTGVPVVVKNIQVISGATTPVPVPSMAWRYMQRLVLNTTPTGAGVAENVFGFPLLVRLRAPAFDFSQAQDSGRDIRFTKADGAPLPYEIEQWDRATGSAAIWVKMDTVLGNNASQFLTMLWGASTGPATLSLSNGAAVFDTANGFAGVWHLGENGVGAPGEFRDATANGNNGRGGNGGDTATPRAVQGWIGNAQNFDGNNDLINCGNTPGLSITGSAITIEAWINIDRAFIADAGILSKQGYNGGYRLLVNQANAVNFQLTGSNYEEKSLDTLVINQWHHVAGVYDGAQMHIFIDGVQDQAVLQRTGPIDSSSMNMVIGHGYDQINSTVSYPFPGMIDEARVSRVARSAAWIKLSFENQRIPNTLVLSTR